MQMKYATLAATICFFIFMNDLATGQSQAPNDFGIANEITGTRQEDDSSFAPSDAQRQERNRDSVINRLAKELDDLIPTDYSKNQAKLQSLKSIARLFIDGNTAAINNRLEQLASEDPDFPPSELLKAGMHYAVSDIQGGGVLLEKLAIEQPDNPAVFIAFSRLAFSQNRISDALAQCEKAQSKLNAGNLSEASKKFMRTQVADSMTAIAKKQNRLEVAEKFAKQWQALAPKSTRMLLELAELKFLRGDISAATTHLKEVRQINPKSRPPEIILASWFQQKSDAVGVEKWIKQAVANHPNDASVHLEYANWALGQEDFNLSSSAVAKHESLATTSATSRLLRARIAFAKQQYSTAADLLADLFKERPNSFNVSNLYVLSLIESDDAKKQNLAKQIAGRNLQALRNNTVAVSAYGWVLLKTGETENASKLLSQAAKSAELPPELTFFVASMLEKTNRKSQAHTLLEPALESKGLFLYRQRARELYQRLGSSVLPAPVKVELV